MKKAGILFALVLTAALSSAQEKRNVGDFTKLNVRGFFDIKLVTTGDLTIKSSDQEIVKDIKTEVENGKLSIYMDSKYKQKHKNAEVTITVPFKNLDEVALSGSGSIQSDATVQADNFSLKLTGSGDIDLEVNAKSVAAGLSGSGDISLKGKTVNFSAEVTGSGDMEAFGLISENTEVTVTGSGDAEVYAKENLKARVSGSGDIAVKGNPKKEDSKVAGSGSITKK